MVEATIKKQLDQITNKNQDRENMLDQLAYSFPQSLVHDFSVYGKAMYKCLDLKIKREKMFPDFDMRILACGRSLAIGCMRTNGAVVNIRTNGHIIIELVDEYTLNIKSPKNNEIQISSRGMYEFEGVWRKIVHAQELNLNFRHEKDVFTIIQK